MMICEQCGMDAWTALFVLLIVTWAVAPKVMGFNCEREK